ncbi:MAG: PKD domain-containing protein, partial [Thermodesulfobacteriota bacterium]
AATEALTPISSKGYAQIDSRNLCCCERRLLGKCGNTRLDPSSYCQGGPAYAWDFGDGATSTLPSPAHAYALPGTYTWTMTVSADGETCLRQGTLEIVQAPAVTSLSKAVSPFRVKVLGSHFEEGVQVFLGGSAQAWPNVIRKSETRLVLKGGASLKTFFPKGVAVVVRVVNPDGGWAEGLLTR